MKRLLMALMMFVMITGSAYMAYADEAAVKEAPAANAPAATAPATAVPAPAPAAAVEEPKPDPSGANTGGAGDVIGATSGAPTKEDMDKLSKAEPLATKLADVIGHNKIAINIVWTLVAGFLVMFMQAGFAMVETGFTRAKNAAHTMAMNFMVYAIGMLGLLDLRLRAADGRRGRRRIARAAPACSTTSSRYTCSARTSASSA